MREVFPMVASSSGPTWLFVGLTAFMLLMVGMFGWFAWASRHAAVEVSAEGLRVPGAFYRRTIPLARLRLDSAAVVSADRGEHRLAIRTNGAGLPGLAAGWFRTGRGEKVLAFVTDPHSVAYIPTTEGYAVMLSVADPAALLASARRAQGR